MMVTMTTMFMFLLFMTPVTMPLHIAEHKVTCMNPQVEESHQFIDISYYIDSFHFYELQIITLL